MANATSNTRITVALVNERVTALAGDIAILTSVVTRLAEQFASAQQATPAPVAEVVSITTAPSTKARKATARKATPKAKAEAAAKVTAASGVTVSLAEAAALVQAGEDKWKILVTSSTTGKPIPYGTVERALKAQARAAGKAVTTATKAPAKRVSKASKAKAALAAPVEPDAATRKALLTMGGKALADAAAQGDANAAWEIARRAAKRAAK